LLIFYIEHRQTNDHVSNALRRLRVVIDI